MKKIDKLVAIDFDATITGCYGWKGIGKFGEPLPGVKEALCRLKSYGCTIIIYTTRGEVAEIAEWLKQNQIPYDYINFSPRQQPHMSNNKLLADVYVDDRAISFPGFGGWNEDLVDYILNFQPWYKLHTKKRSSKYSNEFMSCLGRLATTFLQKNTGYGNDFFRSKYNHLDSYHAIARPWRRLERFLKGKVKLDADALFEVCRDLAVYGMMIYIKHKKK